ncbi:MAG: pyruvate decarboxylase or related thiamine pyrophosphate-requiring enzyme [Pseudomonadota bacterium]|jgi:benzoylformate decarboxylase
MPTVREVTFELLRSLQITTIFGNPGSTELTMFRDFPADFRYVLGLQESVVVGMADGFAQATGNAAFVNLHSAVGVGHAMGNLFTAYRNRTPLVVTAGQQSRSLLQMEPFLFATQPTELPRPYVKWACEPARAEDVPLAIARAYYLAMEPPCGPTFVSVPIDDWDVQTDPVSPREVSRSIRPDALAITQLGEALGGSKRPVFVIGAAVDRDGAWDDLVALAERHGALVWASPLIGRCGFPEDHALFAGHLPAFREEICRRLEGHDVLVAIGAPVFTYHAEGQGPHVPKGLAVFQVTEDPDWAASAIAGRSILGNVRAALRDLLAVPRKTPPAAQRGRGPAPVLPLADPLTDSLLLQVLAQLRTPDSILVEEAPSSRGPMQRHLPILRSGTFFTCSSGGLGYALPAAVGVALGAPGKKVIALLGDGSSMYSIQGLWSAVQLGLPITFVIVNNRRYEALHHFSQRFGISSPVGTDLPGIDFVQLARAQGCEAVRVTRAAELEATLRGALSATRPVLVEVVVA